MTPGISSAACGAVTASTASGCRPVSWRAVRLGCPCCASYQHAVRSPRFSPLRRRLRDSTRRGPQPLLTVSCRLAPRPPPCAQPSDRFPAPTPDALPNPFDLSDLIAAGDVVAATLSSPVRKSSCETRPDRGSGPVLIGHSMPGRRRSDRCPGHADSATRPIDPAPLEEQVRVPYGGSETRN
jgi:hypothetical protein